LNVLLTQPTLDYRQVSEMLGMPIGSVGPTRARSLARLERDAELRALRDLPPAVGHDVLSEARAA
jgi:hypothetical protein